MYIIREVLYCRPGKVRDMVGKFRNISLVLKEMGHEPLRVLTDVAGGPFWTIVAEAKVEKLRISSPSSNASWPTRASGRPWLTTTSLSTAAGGRSIESRAEVLTRSDQQVGTVVIGGSQAGLAVGYHLKQQRRLPFVILDGYERIGDAGETVGFASCVDR